jgi:uncharacterized Tic20 family protein
MSFDVQTGEFDRAGRESKEAPARPVKDWTIFAILAGFICGCMPIGLLGMSFAIQAKKKVEAGDWRGAEVLAERAKICTYFCISWGLLSIFVSVGFVLFSFVVAILEKMAETPPPEI